MRLLDESSEGQLDANQVVDRIDQACETLERAIAACCAKTPAAMQELDPTERWVFKPQDAKLATLMLSAKAVSTLHAACILWRYSHLQEVGALIRIVDDCCNDVMLLSRSFGDGEHELQRARLDEFFHTGPIDRVEPTGDSDKPATARRDKIASLLGRHLVEATGMHNPDKVIGALKSLHTVHSGYVHGNVWRISEMVSGQGGVGFRINVLGTPDPRQASDMLSLLVQKAIAVGYSVRGTSMLLGCLEGIERGREADPLLEQACELDERRALPGPRDKAPPSP